MKACRGLHCWSPLQSPASAAPRQCSPHEYLLRQLHSLGGWAGALLTASSLPRSCKQTQPSTGSSAGQSPVMKLEQSLLALIWRLAHCQKTSTMAVMCTQGSESDCLEVDTAIQDSMLCLLCERNGLWTWTGLDVTEKGASIIGLSVMVLTFPMLRLTINKLTIITSFARHCSAWVGRAGGFVYCIFPDHGSQLQGQNLSHDTAVGLLQLSIARMFDVTARLSTGCNACGSRHRTQQVCLQIQLVSQVSTQSLAFLCIAALLCISTASIMTQEQDLVLH